MTVSEKHIAAARDVFRSYLRRIEYDRRACFEHDELMQEMVAAALAAAEREGMRRAAEIASQCGIDAIDFAKKHIGEHHTDFQRFQDGCEASSAAIRKQVNTHSVAPHPPGATEAGEADPQTPPKASPATHHASRNGDG